eukprot:gb/GECG01006320.1/.p1 GENE.gb/GECG01006320.1/~~gb/GECG01006320.1/.p1  ORF type:complete len:103 (+),score=12.63 gb/GECG01006320.1/:1-309(+)
MEERIWDHFDLPKNDACDGKHGRRYCMHSQHASVLCVLQERKLKPARTGSFMPNHLHACPKYDDRFARDRTVINSIGGIGEESYIYVMETQVTECRRDVEDL